MMNFLQRRRSKHSSFSTRSPTTSHVTSQKRKSRRTPIEVLRSLFTVRQNENREQCMYEVPTVDSYYHKDTVSTVDSCAQEIPDTVTQEEFDDAKVRLLSHVLGNSGDIWPSSRGTSISLYDALNTSNPRLPVSEWSGVARDVAQELTKMHKVGFVHTDLNTSNVLLFRGNLQGPFSTERSWQAKIIGLESAKPMYAASPVHAEATDIYAFGFLMACIGHFCNIRILSAMAERCMREDPSERTPLAVIARELSYFISRYQKKERWGIEIKRRGWSIIDAGAQKRSGLYTKKKTVGVLIAEETDLYEYLMNL